MFAPAPPATPFPAIPYGLAYFKGLRRDGFLYVDKTRFLHALERVRFAFLIRPRRFGKSCWLSLLESYYDRTEAADFDAVFAGTAIAAGPTPNRSRYVVLQLDFSGFGDSLDTLEREFEEYCTSHLRHTLRRNRDLFDAETQREILGRGSIRGQLEIGAGDQRARVERQLRPVARGDRPEAKFRGLALEFCGWELMHSAAVPQPVTLIP